MKKKYLLCLFLIINLLAFNAKAQNVDELLPPKELKDFPITTMPKDVDNFWNAIETAFKGVAEPNAKLVRDTLHTNWKQGKLTTNSATIEFILKNLNIQNTDLLKWGENWQKNCADSTFIQYKSHLVYEAARIKLRSFSNLKTQTGQPKVHESMVIDTPKLRKFIETEMNKDIPLYPYSLWTLFGLNLLLLGLTIRLLVSNGSLKKRLSKLEPQEQQPESGTGIGAPGIQSTATPQAEGKKVSESTPKAEISKPDSKKENGGKGSGKNDKGNDKGDNKPKVVVVVPNKFSDKKYYTAQSTNNEFLDNIYEEHQPNTTFFMIRPYKENVNKGELSIIEDESVRKAICVDRGNYLADHIVEVEKTGEKIYKDKTIVGEVEKKGNYWIIVKPMTVYLN
jgi:hypothetical protein